MVLLAIAVLSIVSPPRSGLLVVGLAGNNGVTLLGGQIAVRRKVTWESSRDGPKSANCLGCITQVGELPKHFDFQSFDDMAIGGWDVVPTGLGDALYNSRIFDYDLVRQVRTELNELPVMRGVWDADFYGESQRDGATYIVPEGSRAAQLLRLREDIRRFKQESSIDEAGGGHVTVVWSASVERPCTEYTSAAALLDAIERDDKENVSPSLVYAAAAILEGCSFVNGGSQNTIQPCLRELATAAGSDASRGVMGAYRPPYALGTDFKAGQTKAKTAIVECARTHAVVLARAHACRHAHVHMPRHGMRGIEEGEMGT